MRQRVGRGRQAAARPLRLLLVTFLLVVAQLGAARGASAAEATNDGPLVGVELAWAGDSAADFAQRLGSPPALYAAELHLPLTGAAAVDAHTIGLQAASLGAGLIITVKPHLGLSSYGEQAAQSTAQAVAQAAEGVTGPVLVRFAPQMNTPWVAWGMQPTAYVKAYRLTTEALRDEAPHVQTVWSPQTGEGYPFPMDDSSTVLQVESDAGTDAALDTNGDGRLQAPDDPYAPFYPGDEWVDWVGLSMLYDPELGPGEATPVPPLDLARDMLGKAEGTDPLGFYQRYVVDRDKPLMLGSGAAYRGGAGPTGLEVKTAWWDQVLRLHTEGYDKLGAVLWHDLAYTDNTGQWVTQKLTSTPELAEAFRETAERRGGRLGPIVEPVETPNTPLHGTTLDRQASWVVVAVTLGLVILLAVFARWVPLAQRLAYVPESKRDLRVDLLRGMAILFVVVDHLGLTSMFHLLSQEAVGIVSGAELFVIFAGIILGIISRPRMAVGMFEAVDRGWNRARELYLWALLVPLTVFALSHVPWLDTAVVTTYSSPVDGPVGPSSGPITYDLFHGLQGLLQYPADPAVVPRLLGLQFGPWQFNILGLYVILLLASPFVLHALHRGRAAWVLIGSVGLYALSQVTDLRLLPFQSDDAFPLLAWQLLFVLGLTGGFFRAEILAFLRTGPGRLVLIASCLAAAGFMLLSWNNPFLSNVYDVRLSLIPDQQFYSMYAEWFGRRSLRLGRLINVIVLVVALFTLLTVLWKPTKALVGWLLIPLGQATLYVFIVHVFLIIVVANIPLVQFGDIWLNTLAYVAVLLTLLVMVRTRFLGGILPR